MTPEDAIAQLRARLHAVQDRAGGVALADDQHALEAHPALAQVADRAAIDQPARGGKQDGQDPPKTRISRE